MKIDYDIFFRFLSNELSTEEHERIQEQLTKNKEFRAEFESFERLYKLIKESKEEFEVRERLNEIGFSLDEPKTIETKKEHSILRRLRVPAAASILILLGFSLIFLFSRKSRVNGEKLFTEYYQPYPSPALRGDSLLALEREAFKLYSNKEYPESIILLDSLISLGSKQSHLYLGNCYLSIDSTEAALSQFLIAADIPKYADVAHWYSALTYLKSNNIDSAKEELDKISPHWQSSGIKSLKRKLE